MDSRIGYQSVHAKVCALCVVLAAGTVFVPAMAQAGSLVASAPDCATLPAEQPFLPWGDPGAYSLDPGGSFEGDSNNGWKLSGGAFLGGSNEPYMVHSSGDSRSLSLPVGSSATSATTCVPTQDSELRFFARSTGDEASRLKVDALFEDALGNVHSALIGVVPNPGSWQPTESLALPASLPPLLPGDYAPVAFKFTPLGSAGSWAIDDVYASFPNSQAASSARACNHNVPATQESDILNGLDVSDLINGNGGEDVINGKAGNDCVHGIADGDIIRAANGSDDVNGGDGPDVFYAVDSSVDDIDCGSGTDRVVLTWMDTKANCDTNVWHSSDCLPGSIATSSTSFTLAVKGCETVWGDTATTTPNNDPTTLWGKLINSCVAADRITAATLGDGHDTAGGTPQSGFGARQLTVFDGDSPNGNDERCELGRNDRFSGPTVFYTEGQHRVTYFSIYLPPSYPLSDTRWQVVMQMKQANPSDTAAHGTGVLQAPILELDARAGEWRLYNDWGGPIWSAPAQTGTWTRFAVDANYSNNPASGSARVFVDLNNDGDVADAYESQPWITNIKTLKTEIDDPACPPSQQHPCPADTDGLETGDPIPGHLRMGIYHDPEIICLRPTGCSVQIDNVQVLDIP